MAFAGLEKVTFMDPATNDRIQINSIDAGLTSFEHGITEDDETTGAAFGGYVYPLVIGARNLTQQMIDLFEEWAELQTPIHVYGYGPDLFLLWELGKPIQFRPVDSTNASSGKRKHVVSISHNGYTDKIKWGANLLHLVAPFVDPFDGYDLMTDFTISSTPTDGYFYTLQVTNSILGSTSRFLFRQIFPISGIEISFRIEAKDILLDSPSNLLKCIFRYADVNGSNLQTDNITYEEGIITGTQKTSADIFFIFLYLIRSDAIAGEELKIGHPQLRAGNNTRYTEE